MLSGYLRVAREDRDVVHWHRAQQELVGKTGRILTSYVPRKLVIKLFIIDHRHVFFAKN